MISLKPKGGGKSANPARILPQPGNVYLLFWVMPG